MLILRKDDTFSQHNFRNSGNAAAAVVTFGLMLGTRMELTPPSFTLILRQRLERVWGEVLFTFLA